MKNTSYHLIRNALGYFEIEPKPTPKELKNHYQKKYYQYDSGNYSQNYSNEEIQYFKVEAKLAEATIKRYGDIKKSLLDIGCGEGFFSRYFHEKGWNIKCVDYSKAGIEKHNPSLLEFFKQDDIISYIDKVKFDKTEYGLLNLDNVLEHVLNPVELLQSMKKIMTKTTIARIEVPNDFSSFQKLLVTLNCTKETWISPPEHLNYFNHDSIISTLESVGFEILSLQADYPIEQFLLNDNSNYWKKRELGRAAHLSRVICTNYLSEKNIEKYIDFRSVSAELEFGRLLTAYVRLRKQ